MRKNVKGMAGYWLLSVSFRSVTKHQSEGVAEQFYDRSREAPFCELKHVDKLWKSLSKDAMDFDSLHGSKKQLDIFME